MCAEGAAAAICKALDDAQIQPEQIGYINAHGTGTPVNDPMETSAIRVVFRNQAKHIPISSTKSMHGHLLGGAGALEAMITVLALNRGRVPPTAFCTRPDPKCAVPLVREQGEETPGLRAAISNSFAFGGTNAALVFSRA